jgi:hypothetical protein
MQEPELHDHQEQEEASGPAGNAEILQHLPEAYGAQGSEITTPEGLVALWPKKLGFVTWFVARTLRSMSESRATWTKE